MPSPCLELLSDYVAWYAQRQPEAEAAVMGVIRYTYAQLKNAVDDYARALMAAGVQPGDRIATLSTPHPDFLILFLAASSIGAIWLGLNPRYQAKESAYIIQDSQPRLLFARERIGSRDYVAELAELAADCESLQAVVLLDSEHPVPGFEHNAAFLTAGQPVSALELAERRSQVRSSDAALIVYTSGSTGRPKGAVISHHALIVCARTQLQFWPAAPIRMVNFLPISHIGCVGDLSCYILLGGGTNIFMEQFDPRASLELMQREKVTVWGGIPTSLQMCVNLMDFDSFDLSSLQIIFWSGAAASPSLVASLGRISPNLSTSYGMTETVGSVTFTDVCNDVDVLAHTIGKPVPQYELRLVDPDGRPVGENATGELQVRGDFIMKEFWNRPQATAETIDADGWLSTGDLAVFLPDGNLKLVGRLKEMFKSGGYNIYPREIEQTIESHPAVAIAAVVGVPDDLYQEVGWAFVSLKPHAELSESELNAHCRAWLANYKVPKKFIIRDRLPTLPVGKIDKQALRQWAEGY
jgi:acyl-CoA synthetase (AMP-forming)/AMP-acid ligase II